MKVAGSLLPPLEPFGRALIDYHRGRSDTVLQVDHSLDGLSEVPVEIFFREPEDFFDFEIAALELCQGAVLDIGAGSGLHSLELQRRGFRVTALEIVPQAVRVMRERGVRRILWGDIFELTLPPVDTAILLMNGSGLAGTLAGLARLLQQLQGVIRPGGQLLIDSAAPGGDPDADPYPGEAWIELGYRGAWGERYRELYCDQEVLQRVARSSGWQSQIIFEEPDGTFVGRLFR